VTGMSSAETHTAPATNPPPERAVVLPATPAVSLSPRIELWTWLFDDVLLAACSVPRDYGIPLEASVLLEDQDIALELQSFCGSGRDRPRTGSARCEFLLLEFPANVRFGDARGCLRIRTATQTNAINLVEIAHAQVGLDRLAEEIAVRVDAAQRSTLMEFISSSLRKRRRQAEDERLSQTLFALRQLLRQPLPRSAADKDKPYGLCVDFLFAADEQTFYLGGWMHDRQASVTGLTAVAPEGQRVELLQDLFLFPRPDVNEKYGLIGFNHSEATHGFLSCVHLSVPSFQSTGWLLELQTAHGPVLEAMAPEVDRAPDTLYKKILSDLTFYSRSAQVLNARIHPVLSSLIRRSQQDVKIKEVLQLGTPNGAPEVSIVVAPVKSTSALEHQLAQFANDAEIGAADLIYVLDEADATAEFSDITIQLFELYRVPFRVVIVSKKPALASLGRIGASLANGRLLLFLSPQVLPDAPGWLGRLASFYNATPRIGALAPKLLHEDCSLHHARLDFARHPFSGSWEPTEPLKGFHGSLPDANARCRVPGVGRDCVMIDRVLYDDVLVSGSRFLTECYDHADLCLRLLAAGRHNWYQPEVELYYLDQRPPALPRAAGSRPPQESYDVWLFNHLWSALLASMNTATSNGHGDPAIPTFRQHDLNGSVSGAHVPGAELGVPRTDMTMGRELDAVPTGSRAPFVTEILEACELKLDQEHLLGARILQPATGHREDTYAVEVEGWVLGRSSPAVTVEVIEGDTAIYRVPVQVRRPRVEAAFPGVPHAATCGFRIAINAIRLPSKFELLLQAVLTDGHRVPFGVLRGNRATLRMNSATGLQPLMLNTLGRSGSTWLVVLLAQHPQLVAYNPFHAETRITAYWFAVLKALTEPLSYTQSLRGELYGDDWWLGDRRPSPMPPLPSEPEIRQWFCREHITTMLAFCRSRIDSSFERVAAAQGRGRARYFVEKVYPDRLHAAMLAELYPRARDVFLVRDFRDMACSMVAFSRRLQREAFGTGSGTADEALLQRIREQALHLLERWNANESVDCLVRYEDLITRPPETLRSVLSSLELDDSMETIDQMIFRASKVRPEAQRDHQTSGGVVDSVGRWHRDLDPALKAASREILGDVLTAFGYSID
jgi:hypothetical protein